ncbi:axoneme-associated protein mst101(2)-like isoform X1 [Onthophagus taurus]|uniref:axoneme-associated protein mst101(2)-like isoform X1 n=3 Tax=Onthophagus taurus TaxID=166361 RepID=UPI0039BE5A87
MHQYTRMLPLKTLGCALRRPVQALRLPSRTEQCRTSSSSPSPPPPPANTRSNTYATLPEKGCDEEEKNARTQNYQVCNRPDCPLYKKKGSEMEETEDETTYKEQTLGAGFRELPLSDSSGDFRVHSAPSATEPALKIVKNVDRSQDGEESDEKPCIINIFLDPKTTMNPKNDVFVHFLQDALRKGDINEPFSRKIEAFLEKYGVNLEEGENGYRKKEIIEYSRGENNEEVENTEKVVEKSAFDRQSTLSKLWAYLFTSAESPEQKRSRSFEELTAEEMEALREFRERKQMEEDAGSCSTSDGVTRRPGGYRQSRREFSTCTSGKESSSSLLGLTQNEFKVRLVRYRHHQGRSVDEDGMTTTTATAKKNFSSKKIVEKTINKKPINPIDVELLDKSRIGLKIVTPKEEIEKLMPNLIKIKLENDDVEPKMSFSLCNKEPIMEAQKLSCLKIETPQFNCQSKSIKVKCDAYRDVCPKAPIKSESKSKSKPKCDIPGNSPQVAAAIWRCAPIPELNVVYDDVCKSLISTKMPCGAPPNPCPKKKSIISNRKFVCKKRPSVCGKKPEIKTKKETKTNLVSKETANACWQHCKQVLDKVQGEMSKEFKKQHKSNYGPDCHKTNPIKKMTSCEKKETCATKNPPEEGGATLTTPRIRIKTRNFMKLIKRQKHDKVITCMERKKKRKRNNNNKSSKSDNLGSVRRREVKSFSSSVPKRKEGCGCSDCPGKKDGKCDCNKKENNTGNKESSGENVCAKREFPKSIKCETKKNECMKKKKKEESKPKSNKSKFSCGGGGGKKKGPCVGVKVKVKNVCLANKEPKKNDCMSKKNVCGAKKDVCGAKKDTCGAKKDTCGAKKDVCGAKKDTCGAKKETCGAKKEPEKKSSICEASSASCFKPKKSTCGEKMGKAKQDPPCGAKKASPCEAKKTSPCSSPKKDPCGAKKDVCKAKSTPPCGAKPEKKAPSCNAPEKGPCLGAKKSSCGVGGGKKKPCDAKKESPCKAKSESCMAKKEPCGAKKESPCKAKSESCMAKKEPCGAKKESPCKAKSESCMVKKEPCGAKKESPCKAKSESCMAKKESPCKAKSETCMVKKEPCGAKKEPCGAKKSPCGAKKSPCKAKSTPCLSKKNVCDPKPKPCPKKEPPCVSKKRRTPCKAKSEPCGQKKEEPCPCAKPCRKPQIINVAAKIAEFQKRDTCKSESPCGAKKKEPPKKETKPCQDTSSSSSSTSKLTQKDSKTPCPPAVKSQPPAKVLSKDEEQKVNAKKAKDRKFCPPTSGKMDPDLSQKKKSTKKCSDLLKDVDKKKPEKKGSEKGANIKEMCSKGLETAIKSVQSLTKKDGKKASSKEALSSAKAKVASSGKNILAAGQSALNTFIYVLKEIKSVFVCDEEKLKEIKKELPKKAKEDGEKGGGGKGGDSPKSASGGDSPPPTTTTTSSSSSSGKKSKPPSSSCDSKLNLDSSKVSAKSLIAETIDEFFKTLKFSGDDSSCTKDQKISKSDVVAGPKEDLKGIKEDGVQNLDEKKVLTAPKDSGKKEDLQKKSAINDVFKKILTPPQDLDLDLKKKSATTPTTIKSVFQKDSTPPDLTKKDLDLKKKSVTTPTTTIKSASQKVSTPPEDLDLMKSATTPTTTIKNVSQKVATPCEDLDLEKKSATTPTTTTIKNVSQKVSTPPEDLDLIKKSATTPTTTIKNVSQKVSTPPKDLDLEKKSATTPTTTIKSASQKVSTPPEDLTKKDLDLKKKSATTTSTTTIKSASQKVSTPPQNKDLTTKDLVSRNLDPQFTDHQKEINLKDTSKTTDVKKPLNETGKQVDKKMKNKSLDHDFQIKDLQKELYKDVFDKLIPQKAAHDDEKTQEMLKEQNKIQDEALKKIEEGIKEQPKPPSKPGGKKSEVPDPVSIEERIQTGDHKEIIRKSEELPIGPISDEVVDDFEKRKVKERRKKKQQKIGNEDDFDHSFEASAIKDSKDKSPPPQVNELVDKLSKTAPEVKMEDKPTKKACSELKLELEKVRSLEEKPSPALESIFEDLNKVMEETEWEKVENVQKKFDKIKKGIKAQEETKPTSEVFLKELIEVVTKIEEDALKRIEKAKETFQVAEQIISKDVLKQEEKPDVRVKLEELKKLVENDRFGAESSTNELKKVLEKDFPEKLEEAKTYLSTLNHLLEKIDSNSSSNEVKELKERVVDLQKLLEKGDHEDLKNHMGINHKSLIKDAEEHQVRKLEHGTIPETKCKVVGETKRMIYQSTGSLMSSYEGVHRRNEARRRRFDEGKDRFQMAKKELEQKMRNVDNAGSEQQKKKFSTWTGKLFEKRF